MSPRALVTDGEQRAALAVVRSLGAAGYDVEVCSEREHSLAGASRYASAEHRVPDPLGRRHDFVRRVRELCEDSDIALVLPVTDASLFALLPERDSLGDAVLPFPAPTAHAAVSDKRETSRRAASVGIPIPPQCVVARPDDLPDASDLPPFPLVVKPHRSIVEGGRGPTKASVTHVDRLDDLPTALTGYPAEAYPLLLQHRIEGTGEGVFVLLWEGELVAAMAHRRIREKPPTGGVSVYRESIPLDQELLERSLDLLRGFDWRGVAMVEFKRERERSGDTGGTPYLMEVNGRFWGSLQLAVDAGVDFPRLLADLALGRPVAPVRAYRTGIRSRWRLGDLDHLLLRWKGRFPGSALPPASPGLFATTLQVLLPWRPGDREEVFRPSDPFPQAVELKEWLSFGRKPPPQTVREAHPAPLRPASERKEIPGD